MKKINLFAAAVALFAFSSCELSSSSTDETGLSAGSYLYTLSSGSWGDNNATLTSYYTDDQSTISDLFLSQNGQGLGDTAQDIVVLDDKIFISVYESGLIFVTDLEGTIITSIVNDSYFYPRYLATDGDYIYVSYYDGAVSKINPDTYKIMATTEITSEGSPEELDAANGNVYVAVSDYDYGNEESVVAVFDASTMEFSYNIAVIENPTALTVDTNGNIYVLSMGNYGIGNPAVYATLQKYDASAENVEIISASGVSGYLPTAIAMGKDNTLYVIEGGYTATWETVGSVYSYNTATGATAEFISDGTSVPSIYSVSTNLVNGEVYVGTSDYYTTGDVYIFNADGTLSTTFEAGLNPMKVVAVDVE